MASLGMAFNAADVQPSSAYEALPMGDYHVMIVDSQMEENKARTGQFLKLQLQVIDGNRKGAMLFVRLNLVNQNPKAVEIAQRDLSAICHAVGILQVTDSAQLHNRPFIVRVTVKEDPSYGPTNEVKGYKPISVAEQPAANQPMHAVATQQPATAQHAAMPATQAAPMAAQAATQPTPRAAASETPPWMAAGASA